MKTLSFIAVFFCFTSLCSSQQISSDRQENNCDLIYNILDTLPQFPGGQEALVGFISNNMTYPDHSEWEGTIYCAFVINTYGDPIDLRILRGDSGALDQEVLRVVKSMPRWTPAIKDGNPVCFEFRMPVRIGLH